jgi:hypothetical protein
MATPEKVSPLGITQGFEYDYTDYSIARFSAI